MQHYRPLVSSGIPIDEVPDLNILFDKGRLEAPEKPRRDPSGDLNSKVILARMDLTKLNCDAIVNAANKSLLGGGGIDGAIHNAAGSGLYQECRTLNGCKTGDAKITKGYRLPAKRVIHTVGPIYHNFGDEDEDAPSSEELLRSCYVRSLDVARDNGCKSVAFPCISTGIYGYPNVEAAIVALRAVREYLEDQEKETEDEEVVEEEIKAVAAEKDAVEAQEEEKTVKAEGDKKEVAEPDVEGEKKAPEPETKPEIKPEEKVEGGETAKVETSTDGPKEEEEEEEKPVEVKLPVVAKKPRVKIEKVMFCTFLEKDQRIYEHFVPIYFPPVPKAQEPEPEPESEPVPAKEESEISEETTTAKASGAEEAAPPVPPKV